MTATAPGSPDHSPTENNEPALVPSEGITYLSSPRLVVAAALCGAWIAAGSAGLLGYPLQRTSVWVCLAVMLFAAPRALFASTPRVLSLLAAVVAAVALTASPAPSVNVCAVAVVLLVMCLILGHEVAGRALASTASAVVGFAFYKLAVASIPIIWFVVNWLAGGLGVLGGLVVGQPLDVGPTFGGTDFLLLSGGFVFLLYRGGRSRGGTWTRVVLALGLIFLLHTAYLAVLAFAWHPMLESLLGSATPWNLPVLALVLHLGAILLLIARDDRRGSLVESSRPPASPTSPRRWGMAIALVGLSTVLPFVITGSLGESTLEGKKIVVFEECFGNWDRPKHGAYGRLQIGMYGMLEPFIRSHGGEYLQSAELADEDLRDADVLILLYPYKDWAPGQLLRIDRFVKNGGSLLVLGEHTIEEESGGSRFNDVLRPTSMRVAFDSATFAVGGWLQSYRAMAHPTTLGVDDQRNQFGVVIGASVEVGWKASPILLGRWGFNDPGDEADEAGEAKMGNGVYDAGERLGDVVLAAEERVGKGTVIAFGDTSSFTNGITIGSHDFNARLLGYLANRPGSPQDGWRQVIGLLLCGGIVVLLVACRSAGTLLSSVAGFAVGLLVSTAASHAAATLVPDGRHAALNNLAYFDCTHLGRFDDESWRLEGTMGMRMTLMRSGFLTLELHEFTWDRIVRAGLVISVAPRRRFTTEECRWVREYVESGGVFVLTASYFDQAGCRELLETLGFEIGGVEGHPGREPQPMGHYKAPFFRFQDAAGEYMPQVRFNEAWPLTCVAGDAQILAYGRDDHTNVAMYRFLAKGAVVVVADTGFVRNKNLEMVGGEPFEGLRENAHFWRWLLTVVRRQTVWEPPRPMPEKEPK